ASPSRNARCRLTSWVTGSSPTRDMVPLTICRWGVTPGHSVLPTSRPTVDGSTVGFDWSFWDASLATTGAGRTPTRESHRYASWYSVEAPSARASTHRNWTIASGRLSTKEYAVPRPKCGPTALESRSTAWRYFSMALG